MSWCCCVALLLAAGPADGGAGAAKANNAFAVDLYKQLRAGEGNLFFSPMSLSTALAMTHVGAGGATADEMAKVLHLDAGADEAFGALLTGLKAEGSSPAYRLAVANALWLQKDRTFLEPFLGSVREHYDAGLFTVDFAGETEAARKKINGWVEDRTADKIRDLIPPGQVDASTQLVLTNAVYFKGDWVHPFKKDRTADGEFHVSGDKVVTVPMMQQSVSVPYVQGDGVQVVSLPYEGERLAMLVVLPDAPDGLKALEDGLTAERLGEWMTAAAPLVLKLRMPRFKATSEFDLKRELSALGMATAFGPGADFSRMTGAKDLFISAVLHKAYADVNEEGTEAAAATAVPMRKSAMLPRNEFNADHPFLYAIYDKTSGAVLFLGRMVDPTAG